MDKEQEKKLMRAFEYAVLDRDMGRCVLCSESGEHAHLIDTHLPNGGWVLENGILLCKDCRKGVRNKEVTREELYYAIRSNPSKARYKAIRLLPRSP